MILAALLLPAADSLSKLLAETYSPLQVVWSRNLFQMILFLPWALSLLRGRRLLPRRPLIHLLRAACFVGGSLAYVAALKRIPLVEAQTLVFVFPLLVIVLSILFLGERVQRSTWIAGALGLTGTVIVLGPGGAIDPPGAAFALLAASTTAIYMLLNRLLADGGRAFLLIIPPTFGAIALGITMPAIWIAPTGLDWGLFLLTGAVFALAHALIIVAFTLVEANRLAPLTYFQMISGVTLGYLLFGDWPDPTIWLGLAAIVGAGVLIQLNSQRNNAQNTLARAQNPVKPVRHGQSD